MALSELGWFNGISALISLSISVALGLIFIYKSKKLGADLLMYAGLMILGGSGLYLGVSLDFLSVFFTGVNMDNSIGMRGILSYMWVPIILIFALYLGTTLMDMKKKWLILSIYIGLAVLFEYFLFFHASKSFDFVYPIDVGKLPGDELIDTSFQEGYWTFIMLAFFLLSGFVIVGIGFLIKGAQSVGSLRKKFYLLSFGTTIFLVCGAMESLFSLPLILVINRSGMMSAAFFFYFGLKT